MLWPTRIASLTFASSIAAFNSLREEVHGVVDARMIRLSIAGQIDKSMLIWPLNAAA